MNKDKEEEQLLQDASTLLMFANVAARQGSPIQSPVQPPIIPSAKQKTPPAAGEAPLKSEGGPDLTGFNQSGPGLHLQSQIPGRGQHPTQPSATPLRTSPGSAQPPKPHLPHLQPAQASTGPNRGYYSYMYSNQPQMRCQPLNLGQPLGLRLMPALGSAITPMPLSKSPGSQPVAKLGDSPPQILIAQKPIVPKTIHPQLSPKLALPVQGSFSTHRRTPSGNKAVSPIPKSPGSANVALARGINVETGKRNNDNAIVAAAALAAAADIPLPLRNKPAQAKETQKSPKEVKVTPPPVIAPVAPKQPKTPVSSIPAELKSEIDDSVVTEDDNNTEEETPQVAKEEETPKEESKPFSAPPLQLYKVDPDAGIIGCICGIEEDDGFTIQCDVCFRWQHCSCMGYKTSDEVPEDEYKCYYCDTNKWNKFDAELCRSDTIARLELDKESEPQNKLKRKPLTSGQEDRKRRKSEKDNRPSSAGERPANDRRKSSNSALSVSSPTLVASLGFLEVSNKENELLEDGVSAEAYQSVYYTLKSNDYKTSDVKSLLEALGDMFEKNPNRSTAVQILPLAQYKATKFSKVILPVHQRYLHDKNVIRKSKGYNKTSVQVKAYSENPKQKFVGISKSGLFITESATPGASYTIPAGTEVIEYLGELDFFELYISNKVNQYSQWGLVKPRVARVDLKLSNDTPSVSVVLDSRFVGNEARFIRKACPSTANCEIKPVFIPQLRAFKFLVVTTKPIILKGEVLEEELRLNWEWDDLHPIRKMFLKSSTGEIEEGLKFEDFTDEEKVLLVSGVDTILSFVECGCNTTSSNQQCAIFKIKKATSYLLRSTRKASSLTNVAFNKSKEELVMPKKARKFISWKERLAARDEMLHSAVFSVTTPDSSASEDDDTTAFEDRTIENATEEKDIDAKKGLFRAPYKRQLLVQGKRFATKYTIDGSGANNTPDLSSDLSKIPKTLAVPIVSELLASIKESVNESLKPFAKISSEVQIALDNEEKKEARTEVAPAVAQEEAPAVSNVVIEEPAVVEPVSKPPPTVKKFSFADYKKKMK